MKKDKIIEVLTKHFSYLSNSDYEMGCLQLKFKAIAEELSEPFKIGQIVRLIKNPLDEQLGEHIPLGNKTIIDVKDVSHIKGTSGQWVKITEYNHWIDSAYFVPVTEPKKDYAYELNLILNQFHSDSSYKTDTAINDIVKLFESKSKE